VELIYSFINLFAKVLLAAIFVRAILSWVVRGRMISPDNPLVTIMNQITDPILAPLRRIIPPLGGMIDITPMVAMLLLWVLISLTG